MCPLFSFFTSSAAAKAVPFFRGSNHSKEGELEPEAAAKQVESVHASGSSKRVAMTQLEEGQERLGRVNNASLEPNPGAPTEPVTFIM
jgi:hypothetical protein